MLEELKRDNDQLRDQLVGKFARDMNDEVLNREVASIKDPSAFAAVKSIMAKMNRQKEEIKQLKSETAQSGNLQKSVSEIASKNKQKDSEIKTLQIEIKKLMTQNEFLLREFEFIQKKQTQGKRVGQSASAAPAQTGDSSQAFYADSLKEVVSSHADLQHPQDQRREAARRFGQDHRRSLPAAARPPKHRRNHLQDRLRRQYL